MASTSEGSLQPPGIEIEDVIVPLRVADIALLRRALPPRHPALEELDQAGCGFLTAFRRFTFLRPVSIGSTRGRCSDMARALPSCAAGVGRVAEYVLWKVSGVLRLRCLPPVTGLWMTCSCLCMCGRGPKGFASRAGHAKQSLIEETDEHSSSSCCKERRRKWKPEAEPRGLVIKTRSWVDLVQMTDSIRSAPAKALLLSWLASKLDDIPPDSLVRVQELLGTRPIDTLQVQVSKHLQRRCFLCPICAHWRDRRKQQACSRGHTWCSACFARWAAQPEQLRRMVAQRSLEVPCLYSSSAECQDRLPEAYVLEAGRCECRGIPRRACECGRLARLCKDLEYRQMLISRANGQACVDCPRPGCVGVAYGGRRKLMCFLCEHQWALRAELPELLATGAAVVLAVGHCGYYLKMAYGMGLLLTLLFIALFSMVVVSIALIHCKCTLPAGCKRCPRCSTVIFKSGGCDHMTCRCGHEFWWTTLHPYPSCQQ